MRPWLSPGIGAPLSPWGLADLGSVTTETGSAHVFLLPARSSAPLQPVSRRREPAHRSHSPRGHSLRPRCGRWGSRPPGPRSSPHGFHSHMLLIFAARSDLDLPPLIQKQIPEAAGAGAGDARAGRDAHRFLPTMVASETGASTHLHQTEGPEQGELRGGHWPCQGTAGGAPGASGVRLGTLPTPYKARHSRHHQVPLTEPWAEPWWDTWPLTNA